MQGSSSSTVSDDFKEACGEIARAISSKSHVSARELDSLRKETSRRYHLSSLPRNPDILAMLSDDARERLRTSLQIKPVRTASGIAIIAVMTEPHPCPHGVCSYCPGGVRVGTPQAYTGHEPAALRGAQNDYDPFRQVRSRMAQLSAAGHKVGKVEIIVMGGTFPSTPIVYQQRFIKGCLDALTNSKSQTLEEAKTLAESSRIRNVGITVETRPDWCKERQVDMMLDYGVTRVEIGVQVLDDKIYELVRRGHTVKDVIDSFRIAKDSSLKVVAHMMPGLPGSSPKKDIESMRRLFEDERFRPDMLKIYPTLLIASSDLYQSYLKGEYKPYTIEEMVEILIEVKRFVPEWVRIMRIQRDIPAKMIVDGVKKSDLRDLVQKEMKRRGWECRCIRCREVGLRELKGNFEFEGRSVGLSRIEYLSSSGKEIFLSMVDEGSDTLVGFARMRLPSSRTHRKEITWSDAALIREIHVYGSVIPVGLRDSKSWQHKGFGRDLMAEAEKIAKDEFGRSKMVVISALGTREYYRKLGYSLEGPYMVKKL